MGSSLSALRNQIGQGQEIQQQYSGGNINYLHPKPGQNEFRLFPALSEDESFIYLRHVYGLEVEVVNEDGTKEIKQKKIFNSRTHGGTPKDIVDEYVSFVERVVDEKLNAQNLDAKTFGEKRKQWLAPINDFKTGLKPEFKWCMYAMELKYGTGAGGQIREISAARGPLEVAFMVGKQIDQIAASYDRPGRVTTIDPFTDPQEGGVLVINYNKEAKTPTDYYSTTLDTTFKRVLTEDDMKWLREQWPLKDQYHLSYRRADFNMAIDGLRRFDQKAGYNVFSSPQFMAIVDEISNYYPQDVNVPMREFNNINQSSSPFDYNSQQGQQVSHQPVGSAVISSTRQQNQSFDQGPGPQQAVQGMSSQYNQQASSPVQNPTGGAMMSKRETLIKIIQDEKLAITVHPSHTDAQIEEFINQERALIQQQNNQMNDDLSNQNQAGGDSQSVSSLF